MAIAALCISIFPSAALDNHDYKEINYWRYCYGCSKFDVTFTRDGGVHLFEGATEKVGRMGKNGLKQLDDMIDLLGLPATDFVRDVADAPQMGIRLVTPVSELEFHYMSGRRPKNFRKAEAIIQDVISATTWITTTKAKN